MLPPVARLIHSALERIRHPSSRAWGLATVLVGILSTGYFIATAFLQGRDLFPKTHDECSYFLQVQMLAHGRLWMPPHPLADFFDSFYILVRPVYCSIYFPGTALMLAPTVWLHLPPWLMPALVSGAAVGMLYCIVTELIDGAAGAAAALLMVSLTWFRTLGMMVMSQAPMLLLGLLLIWAWLRWRKQRHWAWALVIGVLAGWGMITRPVDALCFIIPIGIGMALDLAGQPARRWAMAAALIVAGAAPFFAVQVVFDIGVTGHPFQTPYTLYLNEQVPGGTFGFHQFNPAAEPKSPLPQMRQDYALTQTYLALHEPGNFLYPWFHEQHPQPFAPRPSYLGMIADTALPARILLILLPAGLLGLTDRRRSVLWATLPVFLLLYVFNPFFLEHYAIPIIPAIILSVLLGMESVVRAWPKYRPQVAAALTAIIVVASVTALWEINHLIVRDPAKQITDEPLPSPLLRKAHEVLNGERAVVLFRWSSGHNWKAEPVYNLDAIWPDDEEVIRAHDLGPRDSEIVDYYAARDPQRVFFVWDLGKDELRRIATAGELREAERQGKDLDALLHPRS